jgi:DNA-binding response OmpR family regulator
VPKIMIVEDDAVLASEVQEFLVGSGLTVDNVDSVTVAMDYLKGAGYDLVIIDWNLTDQPGTELVEWIRSLGSSLPILMITGRTHVQDKVAAFRSGIDDYLVKPFHPMELLYRIKALLRRPPIRLKNQLQCGDLTLDLTSRRVTKAGRVVELTCREIELLEFFMRNPNIIFDKQTLLERVWATDLESTVDAVVATILRLRKKVDDRGFDSRIKNHFGLGYSFVGSSPDSAGSP